jgi:hypothetical protein
MSNNWILDVLADLKSFALRNELHSLAEQLDDTTLVAATEIASLEGGARQALHADATRDGTISRRFASRKNA